MPGNSGHLGLVQPMWGIMSADYGKSQLQEDTYSPPTWGLAVRVDISIPAAT